FRSLRNVSSQEEASCISASGNSSSRIRRRPERNMAWSSASRIFIIRLLAAAAGDSYCYESALARHAFDGKASAYHMGAFAHADNAKRLASAVACINAFPVIADCQRNVAVVRMQLNPDKAGLRMTR